MNIIKLSNLSYYMVKLLKCGSLRQALLKLYINDQLVINYMAHSKNRSKRKLNIDTKGII